MRLNRWGRLITCGPLLLWLAAWLQPSAWAADEYWQGIARQVGAELDHAVLLYREGDADAARRAVTQAYFGTFEGSKMEAAMRMELGAKHTYLVERRFGELRKAVKQGDPIATLALAAGELRDALLADAGALDAAGIPPEVFPTGQ